MEKILRALRALRVESAQGEFALQRAIAEALTQAAIPYIKEAPLFPRARIDFLCGTVGIEVKQKRPSPTALRAQVERYMGSERITALIVVAGRGVRLPERIGGKPVVVVCLDRLWGVAL